MTSRSMIRVSFAVALMCAATGVWAQGKQGMAAGKPDKGAQTFIIKAVQGNLAEVSMGQLAQQQSQSPEVRSYGQQLVTDHTAAGKTATAAASQLGVIPPSEPSKKQLSDHHKLMKMSGAAFDRAFVQHMAIDHRKEIAEHKRAAKMKNDVAAGYAAQALPALEKHLEIAQSLSKSMGKGGAKAGKPAM